MLFLMAAKTQIFINSTTQHMYITQSIVKGMIIFVHTTDKCTCKGYLNSYDHVYRPLHLLLVHRCSVPLLSGSYMYIVTNQKGESDIGGSVALELCLCLV